MHFPFKNKSVVVNESKTDFLNDYTSITEVPILPHPGAFSCTRKNHIHEGIDLYCRENEEVFAMESGKIVSIAIFTGQEVGMPWWNTTWSVMIEGSSGVINYGEIKPLASLYIGQMVQEGDLLGNVVTVLKKDKGRPMNMLHLELYEHGVTQSINAWPLETPQPAHLRDPMQLLSMFLDNNKKTKLKF